MSVHSEALDSLEIAIEFLEPVREEVDAGADLSLTMRLSSSSEMDLNQLPFVIMAAGDVRLAGELTDFSGEENDIVKITLAAPEDIGEFHWDFVIPDCVCNGKNCRKAFLPFAFRTRPHVTSLAVWDYPSPVVVGEKFKLKVAARCSAACATLQNKEIEIRDETDAVVASVALSDNPWPETSALYWADVELTAPGKVGLHTWAVKFSPIQLGLPHSGASFAFSLVADRPPEHTVIVKVVEEQTEAPIDDVQLRLGAYRASTDAVGMACLTVPKGEHELFIWKVGYEAPARTVQVNSDAKVQVEAKVLPIANPDLYWQG